MIDLHLHYDIDNALALAKYIEDKSISLFSISNHDKITIPPKNTVHHIFASEFSTYHSKTNQGLHILGYFSKPIEITEHQEIIEAAFNQRSEKFISIINHEVIPISLEDLGFIQDTIFYELMPLVQSISTKTNIPTDRIYKNYVKGRGLSAYLPDTNRVTSYIKDLIGIAILAHPLAYKHEILSYTNELGIDGIECYCPSSKGSEKKLEEFANQNDLLITGGSDYHFSNPKKTNYDYTFPEIQIEKFLKNYENRFTHTQ
ncbi:MAG: hypothetical protein WCJ03_10110 [Bacteroidales bacterium]|jgi:hypothetical protein